MKPKCPYCGELISLWTEGECGAHPGVEWHFAMHDCDSGICIEVLQKGGSMETVVAALNKRTE